MIIIIWVIAGIIMSGLAYLVHNKKMYDFISGYNTSSDEEKKEYEKNGYLAYTGRFLWGMAFTWIIGIPFVILDLPYVLEIHTAVFLLYTLVGTVIAQKYVPEKKKKKGYIITISISVLTLVFVAVLFFMGMRPSEVIISEQTVSFSGMYSHEVQFEEIESVELTETLPSNLRRTNGFGTSTRLLGRFSSNELGKGRMYVFTEYPPYIFIDTKDGFIIVNSKDAEKTIQWYNLLRGKTN